MVCVNAMLWNDLDSNPIVCYWPSLNYFFLTLETFSLTVGFHAKHRLFFPHPTIASIFLNCLHDRNFSCQFVSFLKLPSFYFSTQKSVCPFLHLSFIIKFAL
jgi:hypothetical protein